MIVDDFSPQKDRTATWNVTFRSRLLCSSRFGFLYQFFAARHRTFGAKNPPLSRGTTGSVFSPLSSGAAEKWLQTPQGRQVPLRRTWIGYIFNFLVRPFWRNIDNGYRRRSIHRRSHRRQVNSLTRSMAGVYISVTWRTIEINEGTCESESWGDSLSVRAPLAIANLSRK